MPREDAVQHVFDMRVKLHTGFVLGEIAPIGHEIVWGPGLDGEEKRKIPCRCWISNPDSLVIRPVESLY